MSAWGLPPQRPVIRPTAPPDPEREPQVTLVATVPVDVLDRVVGLARTVPSDLEVLLGPTACTVVLDAARRDLERVGQALILEGHEDLALVEDDVLDEVLRPHEASVPAEARRATAWLALDDALPDTVAALATRLQQLGHPAVFDVTTDWSGRADEASVAAGRAAAPLLAEVDAGEQDEVLTIPDEQWMVDAPDAADADHEVRGGREVSPESRAWMATLGVVVALVLIGIGVSTGVFG
ncbi:MAG: hypothetical protein JJT89_06385 [Nitriliruptoraceae bacterium]|nr:hypothetical protein [Nitriliruptoraceae bacterium]